MDGESKQPTQNKTAPFSRANGGDIIGPALDHLRRVLPATGETFGSPTVPRQKEKLLEWVQSLGLLLNPELIFPRLSRGGQEHDIFPEGERLFKVTRHGIFGLSPGIELALVSSSQDPRRFHLWEATPLEYLERLHLHNLLVPSLNVLEGVVLQSDGDLAIVTSQPLFEIVPVTDAEIDAWFAAQGFEKITHSGYYRSADNLGIFDAHDKNIIRAGEVLVPFDVIPCHPAGGFLQFINDVIASGHTIEAVRTITTTKRPAH